MLLAKKRRKYSEFMVWKALVAIRSFWMPGFGKQDTEVRKFAFYLELSKEKTVRL